VRIECLILPGNERFDEIIGKILDKNRDALLFSKEFSDEATIDIIDFCWERRLEFGEIFCSDGIGGSRECQAETGS